MIFFYQHNPCAYTLVEKHIEELRSSHYYCSELIFMNMLLGTVFSESFLWNIIFYICNSICIQGCIF